MVPVSNGFVERVIHGNDDLTAVNAARVSFAKQSDELNDKDVGLIRYLAKHDHWTPFSHIRVPFTLIFKPYNIVRLFSQAKHTGLAGATWKLDAYGSLQMNHSLYGWLQLIKRGCFEPQDAAYIYQKLLEIAPRSVEALTEGFFMPYDHEGADVDQPLKGFEFTAPQFHFVTLRHRMPIAIARQWFKHQVGITRNEVSRRYVDEEPEFFQLTELRLRAENVKQGSSDETVPQDVANQLTAGIKELADGAKDVYTLLVDKNRGNICPEQARFILPQSMLTEFWETGSLADYARICKLRLDPHAQKEVRLYAQAVDEILTNSPDLASKWLEAKESA